MNRLDRLTAILLQLQGKRVVRAQEIADRFGISLRTVYRDVRSLETAGVPVIGEAGVGYALAEGYRLPPVQFSADEAAAFLTAEKLVEQFTDAGALAQYQAGMHKIRAVLRLADKDTVEQLDAAVQVQPRRGTAASESQHWPLVLQAIARKEALALLYGGRNDAEPQRRVIEPLGVFFQNDAWYVAAWCRLRSDLRNFRLDRMQQVRLTGSPFERGDLSLQTFLEAQQSAPLLDAQITVLNEALPYLDRDKRQYGFVRQEAAGPHTRMLLQTPSYEYLARWAMQFADKVVALEPPALHEAFVQQVKVARERWLPENKWANGPMEGMG